MKKTVLLPLVWIVSVFLLALLRADDPMPHFVPTQDDGSFYELYYPLPENPQPDELKIPVEWRLWIPPHVKTLRGIVIHQHGCGDGSNVTGRTAVYDLHWQELARQHDCALLAATFRQKCFPDKDPVVCGVWCHPDEGSLQSMLNALNDFARLSGHSELPVIPWALWGHSGGGHWAGSLVHLCPERIVCAWLRSGHPDCVEQCYDLLPMNDAVRQVPVMFLLGKEEYDTRNVWELGWPFLAKARANGENIGFILDQHTQHECGASRYMAIPWIDLCLSARLPETAGTCELRPAPEGVILTNDGISDEELSAESAFVDQPEITEREKFFKNQERREFLKEGIWLPKAYVETWRCFMSGNAPDDLTPPPAPESVQVTPDGTNALLTWVARADMESGIRTFKIYKNGELLAELPTRDVYHGRPLFQGSSYSDTPDEPIAQNRYTIENYDANAVYSVTTVNTFEMESPKTAAK